MVNVFGNNYCVFSESYKMHKHNVGKMQHYWMLKEVVHIVTLLYNLVVSPTHTNILFLCSFNFFPIICCFLTLSTWCLMLQYLQSLQQYLERSSCNNICIMILRNLRILKKYNQFKDSTCEVPKAHEPIQYLVLCFFSYISMICPQPSTHNLNLSSLPMTLILLFHIQKLAAFKIAWCFC
jgi:hypothetical protein